MSSQQAELNVSTRLPPTQSQNCASCAFLRCITSSTISVSPSSLTENDAFCELESAAKPRTANCQTIHKATCKI